MEHVLILGGTNFIGRNLIEQLSKKKSFKIHLFNRGKTNTHLNSNYNWICGDRETEDAAKITGRKWDYIIDLSCYYPNGLSNVLKGLKFQPKKYIFISTCSVYDNEAYTGTLRTEDAPTLGCTERQATDTSNLTYGNRKAECERILMKSNLKYLILRPALVYGKYDPTDRLYFWLHKLYGNKPLLLPEGGKRLFSMTYVNDLVNYITNSLKDSKPNQIVNAISHPQTSIDQIKQTAAAMLNSTSKAISVSKAFLVENKVKEWMELPLWLSSDSYTYNNQLFYSEGELKLTLLSTSLEETIKYYRFLDWPEPTFGMGYTRYNALKNLYLR